MHVPKVSIVILSHRFRTKPEMVRQCVDSAKAQTYPNVQIVHQMDEEAWGSKLNDVVGAARGEWVIPLCDDDMLDPRYVSLCMEAAPFADLIYTDRMVFQDGGDPRAGFDFRMHGTDFARGKVYRVRMGPEHFAFGCSLPMTIMVRKQLWDALHGYDDVPHADTEFWFRSVMAGAKTVYVPEPLFWYREHPGQYSRLYNSMHDALQAFHHKHFQLYGYAFNQQQLEGSKVSVQVVPKAERVSYAQRFNLPTTGIPNMATEARDIPDIAKTAIVLARQQFENQMAAIQVQALTAAGLSPNDGWVVDGQTLQAQRAIPDAPTRPALVTEPPAEATA